MDPVKEDKADAKNGKGTKKAEPGIENEHANFFGTLLLFLGWGLAGVLGPKQPDKKEGKTDGDGPTEKLIQEEGGFVWHTSLDPLVPQGGLKRRVVRASLAKTKEAKGAEGVEG